MSISDDLMPSNSHLKPNSYIGHRFRNGNTSIDLSVSLCVMFLTFSTNNKTKRTARLSRCDFIGIWRRKKKWNARETHGYIEMIMINVNVVRNSTKTNTIYPRSFAINRLKWHGMALGCLQRQMSVFLCCNQIHNANMFICSLYFNFVFVASSNDIFLSHGMIHWYLYLFAFSCCWLLWSMDSLRKFFLISWF